MSIQNVSAFKDCYIMQSDDIKSFADTLADGFNQYSMFQYACNDKYDHDKIRLFWAVTIAVIADNAICIADSPEFNSVLAYVRPKSKEASFIDYVKAGGLKMFLKLGWRSTIKLMRFDAEMQRVAKRLKDENDGYLMCFATRLDKQGQGYGKPLMEGLLCYLDSKGEGCYLETLKATNVELYKHFSFELVEQTTLKIGNMPLYAMRRSPK